MAAQGTDGRLYPWGNLWVAANVPAPDQSRAMRGPDPVDAHPQGASPYGVMDMVGNVWQWTDEFTDEHTRGAILRGGEYYQPQGSLWYFPPSLLQRPAQQAAADGAGIRSLRRSRLPLCARREIEGRGRIG